MSNILTSKSSIDKLGTRIRKEGDNISDDTLSLLQSHRISHKEPLSKIFSILCSIVESMHPSSIVTYRTKRFESIIGKLSRFETMRLSAMWDIGGCRCILRDDKDVFFLRNLIIENDLLDIVKENNYINEPKSDGYKSLHLYIKLKNHHHVIEVQVRNQTDHNWATLVEITDFLFESKIKESNKNTDLSRLHYLLSKKEYISIEEKYEIRSITSRHKYFERLSMVFSKNYLQVRNQWMEIESSKLHTFFLIETAKEKTPTITAYKNFQQAEESYFNAYKSNHNANIVLTRLTSPNYNKISIAYSNYILTFHSFFTEYYTIIEDLILDSIKNKGYYDFYKLVTNYNKLLYTRIYNIMEEVKEINNLKNKQKINRTKEREWKTDLQKQISQIVERSQKFNNLYSNNLPNSEFKKFIFKKISDYSSNKHINAIKLIATSKGLEWPNS